MKELPVTATFQKDIYRLDRRTNSRLEQHFLGGSGKH
jgi:hypothetical protein